MAYLRALTRNQEQVLEELAVQGGFWDYDRGWKWYPGWKRTAKLFETLRRRGYVEMQEGRNEFVPSYYITKRGREYVSGLRAMRERRRKVQFRRVVEAAATPNANDCGSVWSLTLACGHTAQRHRMHANRGKGGKVYPKPCRVRCEWCQRNAVA